MAHDSGRLEWAARAASRYARRVVHAVMIRAIQAIGALGEDWSASCRRERGDDRWWMRRVRRRLRNPIVCSCPGARESWEGAGGMLVTGAEGGATVGRAAGGAARCAAGARVGVPPAPGAAEGVEGESDKEGWAAAGWSGDRPGYRRIPGGNVSDSRSSGCSCASRSPRPRTCPSSCSTTVRRSMCRRARSGTFTR